MREILFRAKRRDNGRWVEGYFCGGTCDSPFGTEIRKCAMIVEKETLWWFEADPETVCQYTGLTDKYGVKIFEGDEVYIIQEDIYGKVRWSDGDAAFYVLSGDTFISFLDHLLGTDVEVIGNIYDKGDDND